MFTPITAFYAGLLGMFLLYLSALVIQGRLSKEISLGDGGDTNFQQLSRAHGNFTEYAPLVLILLYVAEVNGSNSILLHCAGSALLFGRIIHAFGLRRHSGPSWQRVTGMLMTFASLLLLSVMNILISYR